MCCDVRCGGVIKMCWCNVMCNMVRGEMFCGCGIVVDVDVEWCEMWTVAV